MGSSSGWGKFAQGELFMQIMRSLSSEIWVSRRASTTSKGKRPVNGFPSVAVREGGGVESNGLRVLMAGVGSLSEAVKAFLERGTHLLCVARDFRGWFLRLQGGVSPD